MLRTSRRFVLCAAPVLAAALFAPAVAAAPSATGTDAGSPAPPAQELGLNLFRNPSIGLEYRRGTFAVHAGAYPTVIRKSAEGRNETSWFLRVGFTVFFLGKSFYGQRPSELYLSQSYVRGFDHAPKNGSLTDVGYRWMVWRGLNLRLGVALLLTPAGGAHVNPTPGIGWSQSF